MNLKERFDIIITEIENKATEPYGIKAINIAEDICQNLYINIRDFNAIFKFLTDMSPLDYIRERKMMAAYKIIIEETEYNPDPAIEVSGLENQQSFGKKFKETFNITPKEAFEIKDDTLYTVPLSWDTISTNVLENVNERFETEEIKFGIERTQYNKIMEALDYQALYNLNDIQSEIAFQISKNDNKSLKEAFTLVYEYLHYCECVDNNKTADENAKFLLSVRAKRLKHLYFKVTQSVYGAMELIEEAEDYGCKIGFIDPEYLYVHYEHHFCELDELLKHIKNFEALGGKDFEEYMQLIHLGVSEEDAAKGMDDTYAFDYETITQLMENSENESFEKWAAEQTDYANCEKIDIEYDEDNPCYSNDDEGNEEDMFDSCAF